jgi:glyoxylate/hydroxypyruvate reductase A
MVVLLITPRADQAELWRRLLSAALDDVDVRVFPDTGDPASIDVALAWKAPQGALAGFPNLRLICSLGMGVDHLLDDPLLPEGVPIARLVDPNMIEQMSEYVLYAVLHFHRHFDVYDRFQRERRWEELPLPHTAKRRVGIMGLGAIGEDCARKLAALGFKVSGWSRSEKSVPGVESFVGMPALPRFLARTEILVSVLPLTPETAGIINSRLLEHMPRGSFLVNVARGQLVVEPDLVDALESGRLAGAMLDVTAIEPLPANSPLWRHPRVRITPHIAGLTNPETAVGPIAENIKRLRDGHCLLHLVDRQRGY